jgi:hypothetical protein
MRTVLAASLALAAACAHPFWREREFSCPGRGGPAWVEVATEHFTLAGDLTRGEGAALARALEQVRSALLQGLFPDGQPLIESRVRVVVFRRQRDFDEFAPPGLRAFLSQNGLGEPVIVMRAEDRIEEVRVPLAASADERNRGRRRRDAGRRGEAQEPQALADLGRGQRLVIAHELTHHILRHVYPRQPRWFGEGLAALAEGLAERAAFGRLPREASRGFERDPVAVRELLGWDGRTQDRRHHDASAVLVHHLLHAEPDRFDRFRRQLAAAERPEAAWRDVFPEWDPAVDRGPEALDGLLGAHARAPGSHEWPSWPTGGGRPTARELAAGEVHALRLMLTRFNRGRPGARDLERAEMEEALAEDPGHVLGLQVRAALLGLDPLPLARLAAETHPDDLRALLWLAQSLPRDGSAEAERLAVLRRAVSVAPWSAMASGNLAWFLVQRGDLAEALPLAERAVKLSPGNPNTLDTLAAVLEAAQRCPEALRTAERALDFLPEHASGDARAPWTERAGRLRRACGVAAAQ